jgi:anti-sigma regulatory factor (Ser/Thr protein kinase)
MSIGAELSGVAQVNAAFGDFADAHALPDGVRRSMVVALDELLTNTISYGLAAETGEVSIEVELHPDRLSITLSDNGTPFDPFVRTPPDTTLSIEARRIGGLGIHLVQKMLDEVSHEYRDGRNIVVLTMRLGSATPTGNRGEH